MVCPKCNKRIEKVIKRIVILSDYKIFYNYNINEPDLDEITCDTVDEYFLCPECDCKLSYDECIKALKD